MVKANLTILRQRIREAALRADRNPDSIELVVVTKNVEIPQILEAYEAGERKFGENRVQELVEKQEKLPRDIEWHLIGHLQTNKVKFVLDKIHLIHSVDSVRLAHVIEERAVNAGKTVQVLIQVNVAHEGTKYGISPEEFPDLMEKIRSFKHIRLQGLMTMAPLGVGREEVRSTFRALASLRDQWIEKSFFDLKYLSMGMTHDFEIAIEEGANLIRIGTAVFGPRGRTDAAA